MMEVLSQHLVSVLTAILMLGFVASVLSQRRPSGSAFAWILIILLIPYLGIPLYLMFGGRKFRRQVHEKAHLNLSASPVLLDRVEWLDHGVKAYETFLHEIRTAKKAIRLTTFVIGDDEVGRSLLEALTERAKEGLEVHVLLDDLLSFHAPRGHLRRFRAAGGRLRKFMPLVHLPFRGRANLRNHRKIAIFDGERAIVGGMNLATEYMGPRPDDHRWRDLSVLVTGGVVEGLDSIFRQDWQFASREKLNPLGPAADRGSRPVRIVPCGPDSANDSIYEAILSGLFTAKRRFWIATPYFVPDEVLTRALAIAAHRGVDVRIVVPERSNHPLSDNAAGPFLRELALEGVKIVRYQNRMLHAKTLLIDDNLAVVGSANFDMRSLFLNYEIALFLSTEPEIRHLEKWFVETMSSSLLGPPQVGRVRAAYEDIVRLFAPLL